MKKNREVISWSEVMLRAQTNKRIKIGENIDVEPNVNFVIPTTLSQNYLVIGDNVSIMSNSIIYFNTKIGERTLIAHAAIIREGCEIGVDVVIGARSELQESVRIGEYSRVNSNVLISGNSVIGSNCWILPNVVITNDPNPPSHIRKPVVVRDYAVICVGALLMPGISIGKNSFIGPGSVVTQSVPDDMCVINSKLKGPASNLRIKGNFNQSAYPWTDRYP
jgi:acetyltransferase-like isoleucine patch superfamily enzyme